MTLGVAGGVAHADSPAPSSGDSNSQDSQGAEHPGPPGAGERPARAPSIRFGGPRDRQPRHLMHLGRDRTEKKADADAGPAVSVQTSTDTDDSPRTRRADRRLTLTGAATKPLKPAKPAKPLKPVKPAEAQRLTPSIEPPPAVHETNSASRAAIAAIAPADPVTPKATTRNTVTDLPQLGRQATGLVSDVGVVAASAVYTVANTVAKAVGPNDFLGVPYAIATALANTAAAAGRTLIGAPLETASTGRFPVTYGVLDGLAFFNPQQPPPGANDPSITVTPEHPLPIILVNGTTATQGTNWSVGAPVLANAGYKVYTFNYGNVTGDPNSPIQATGDIAQSAQELSDEVDFVLTETKAPKVILIGHSQGGGILAEYYINNLGGDEKVSQLIGIAPSNHGTDFNGLTPLLGLPVLGPLVTAVLNVIGPAFIQQTVGSDFQQEVYGHGDTRPGVLYTTIASTHDEVVTPYTQQALDGSGVTNIVIQDLYPGIAPGHLGVVLSPQVWDAVLDALASNPEANPQIDPLESQTLAA